MFSLTCCMLKRKIYCCFIGEQTCLFVCFAALRFIKVKCFFIITAAKCIRYILTTLSISLNHYFHSSVTYSNRFVSGSYHISSPPFLQKSPTSFLTLPHSVPISLDSGLLLSLSYPADGWLEVETEKEALGVFIETLSFTRTITTLPHTEKQTKANWLFVSHLHGSVCATKNHPCWVSHLQFCVCNVSTWK